MNAFNDDKVRALFNVHKKCALSDLQKQTNGKKKDVSKVLLSPFKVCTCRFPSWKAEQCRRRRVRCLWERPSWVRNSLYGGSISRQVPFSFFLVLKFRNPPSLWTTCTRPFFASWTFQAVNLSLNSSNVRLAQTPNTNVSRRTRKTSQSSDAWKNKTNRRFPECLQVYN